MGYLIVLCLTLGLGLTAIGLFQSAQSKTKKALIVLAAIVVVLAAILVFYISLLGSVGDLVYKAAGG